jgi:hypothetical protein
LPDEYLGLRLTYRNLRLFLLDRYLGRCLLDPYGRRRLLDYYVCSLSLLWGCRRINPRQRIATSLGIVDCFVGINLFRCYSGVRGVPLFQKRQQTITICQRRG